MGKQKVWGSAWRVVLLVYISSRLFYLVAGAIFARVIPGGVDFRIPRLPAGANIWATWDGVWYTGIAMRGYEHYRFPASTAFFPVYPALMRYTGNLFGGSNSVAILSLMGVLVSLTALLFAFYFIYRIAEESWGQRVAVGTILTLAFFPTAFFLNSTYTESLFLVFSAGAIWAVRVRKDLLLACILAAFAAATRNVGIFLLIPLAYEWLKGAQHYRWRVIYLGLAPSGLIAYMGYLWYNFGDPLLYYKEQGVYWNRQATNPIDMVGMAWNRAIEGIPWAFSLHPGTTIFAGTSIEPSFVASNTYNLLFLGFIIAMLVLGIWWLPPDLNVYAFTLTIMPALYGTPDLPLMSLSRFTLVAFPLFIVLGILLKNRWALATWLLVSAGASLFLTALFVTWRWVA